MEHNLGWYVQRVADTGNVVFSIVGYIRLPIDFAGNILRIVSEIRSYRFQLFVGTFFCFCRGYFLRIVVFTGGKK
jgi:hypothetical protein